MPRPLKKPAPGIAYPNRLLELRARHGVSQTQVGRVLGVNQTTVAKLELGRQPMRDDQLRALARYYGVPVSYVLNDDVPGVPVMYRIGRLHDPAAALATMPRVTDYVPPPAGRSAATLVGACFHDDAAAPTYPAGTVLLAGRLESYPKPIRLDGTVDVICRVHPPAVVTRESIFGVLLGRLRATPRGELRLDLHGKGESVLLRPASVGRGCRRASRLALAPRAGDLGEVLGVVEGAHYLRAPPEAAD